MNWRILAIGIIAGMLVSTLLYVPLTGSQARNYDPWADINDDGEIDGWDIAYTCRLFGTTGDPTKPVIINGYYVREWNKTVELNESESITYRVSTAGLKTLTLQVSIWPRAWVYILGGGRYGYANATITVRGQILNRTVWSETKNLDAYIYISPIPPIVVPPAPDEPFHYINTDTIFTRVYSLACSSVEVYIYARSPIDVTSIFYVTT